jgi:hypothetical protein
VPAASTASVVAKQYSNDRCCLQGLKWHLCPGAKIIVTYSTIKETVRENLPGSPVYNFINLALAFFSRCSV